MTQPDLFTYGANLARSEAQRVTRSMYRPSNPRTSKLAAQSVTPHLSKLHSLVLEAFKSAGELTDEELENRPEFRGLAPSTCRKRRSELVAMDKLEPCGERVNSRGIKMVVWRIK